MEHRNTLSEKIKELRGKGYTLNFEIEDNKLVCKNDESIDDEPGNIHIANEYRFEGMSSPADLSILYAIESSNGKKGLLVDGYGAYNSKSITKFMKSVKN